MLQNMSDGATWSPLIQIFSPPLHFLFLQSALAVSIALFWFYFMPFLCDGVYFCRFILSKMRTLILTIILYKYLQTLRNTTYNTHPFTPNSGFTLGYSGFYPLYLC